MQYRKIEEGGSGQKALVWLNIAFIIFAWFVAISSYGNLPDRIPTHFNFAGKPDAWGTKSLFSVFMLPLVQSILVLLILWLRKYPYLYNFPHKKEVRQWPEEYSRPVYNFLKRYMLIVALLLNLTLTFIQFMVINAARTGELGSLATPIMILMAIMWIPLLIYLLVKISKIIGAQKQAMKNRTA